tara:strand:+ start:12600 stop:12980 length:381 start_codon:yes stop_codon:yes gene_type:complete
MPVYSYKCQTCETAFEKTVIRSQCTQPQTCECGEEAKRVVGEVSFVLAGDGWVGKNQKIKGQMAQKNARLSVKSRERRHDAPGIRLAPNVGGERVESWDEAAKLAESKGLDGETYKTKAKQAGANG